MNKLLPKRTFDHKGFTLVELLVVVVIIAILATIGFAVFSGMTTRGNDSKRLADIKAIADAYENKRTSSMADYGGLALATTDFAAGVLPTDPVTTRRYCIKTDTVVITNPSVSATEGITATGTCAGTWTAVGTTAIAANPTFFKICVLLSGNTTADIRCQGSKQ